MKRRLARAAWSGLKILGIAYLGVLLVLSFFENRLVFRPASAAESWIPPPTDEIRDVELTSAAGDRLVGWWLPCPGSERTILYFHGNAGNLSHRGNSIVKMRKLLNAAVFIIDYPGYGKSSGSPTEAGAYQAADAAYDWLVQSEKRDPKNLILYGGSLGGGVAIELATRKTHQALVVVKSFTSVPDVGAGIFPWLPVRWIMRTRFDSIGRISTLRGPVFIAHGDRDTIIPYAHGEALYAAANEPKRFHRLEGQNHNDALPEGFFAELKRFLGD